MRIAILTNDDPLNPRGGTGRVVAVHQRMLEKAGHEVRVHCPIVSWFAYLAVFRFLYHILDLRARRNLVREILYDKPDILVTHNVTGCGFKTARVIQGFGIRWVHVLHDIQLFEPSGQSRDISSVTLWQRVWSLLRLHSFGSPDLVISPTQWLLDVHLTRGFFRNTRMNILPNPGPDIERFTRTIHDPVRLLFVGRVTEDKGSRLLQRLTQALSGSFILTVIGQGPDVSLFDHDVRVRCLGALPIDRVRDEMRENDILLVPSQIEENQPTVILEAASVGLPVIASNMGGIPETLGHAGMLCDARDENEWQQAIQLLLNFEYYKKIVEEMYALAERHVGVDYEARFISNIVDN